MEAHTRAHQFKHLDTDKGRGSRSSADASKGKDGTGWKHAGQTYTERSRRGEQMQARHSKKCTQGPTRCTGKAVKRRQSKARTRTERRRIRSTNTRGAGHTVAWWTQGTGTGRKEHDAGAAATRTTRSANAVRGTLGAVNLHGIRKQSAETGRKRERENGWPAGRRTCTPHTKNNPRHL